MARPTKKQPIFVTKRLRLRAFRAGDLGALHTLYSDTENLRYWNTPPSSDIAATRRSMKWHLVYRPRYYAICVNRRARMTPPQRGVITHNTLILLTSSQA